jgi:hypothetical protein
VLLKELKEHAPFTALGSLTGIVIILVIEYVQLPLSVSERLFWSLHPAHVFLSALVTTGVYRLYGHRSPLKIFLIGYIGSVGIGSVSDSLIPYVGEWLLNLPHRELHLGFIEKWWLVNPLAILGISVACFYPKTKFPHAGHVLLSTWASLFHMMMALGNHVEFNQLLIVLLFLFLSVWIPCCTSDIIFPLIFVPKKDLK